MIDLLSLQCSLNKAVSSLLEYSADGSELDSIRAISEILDFEEDFGKDVISREFLDNLERLSRLLCVRFVKLDANRLELSHVYLRVISRITFILLKNEIKNSVEDAYIVILRYWSMFFCTETKYETVATAIDTRDSLLIDLIELISYVYNTSKSPDKLIYILLELLKYSKNKKLILRILSILSTVPDNLDILQVYPGLVSRIASKLSTFNEPSLKASIKLLATWITNALELKRRDGNTAPKAHVSEPFYPTANPMHKTGLQTDTLSTDGKASCTMDQLLCHTCRLIEYLLNKYSCRLDILWEFVVLCTSLECLYTGVKLLLVKRFLKCVEGGWISDRIGEMGFSYKLLIRDEVMKSISTMSEDSLSVYRAYLMIKEHIPCEVDFYISLRFLLNHAEDITHLDDRVSFNNKFIIEDIHDLSLPSVESAPTSLILPDDNFTKTTTIYFQKLPPDLKLDCIYNILSLIKPTTPHAQLLKLLQLLYIFLHTLLDTQTQQRDKQSHHAASHEVIRCMKPCLTPAEGASVVSVTNGNSASSIQKMGSPDQNLNGYVHRYSGLELLLSECRDIFVSEGLMDALSSSVQLKFRLLLILRLIVVSGSGGFLSHDDVELLLRHGLVEYNSDYLKVSQLSGLLLIDLNDYFLRCKHLHTVENSIGIRPILQFYTNKLLNRNMEHLNIDIIYALTSFNNQSIDPKLLFDLAVALSKAFDKTDDDVKLLEILYSYNHLLLYIKRSCRTDKRKHYLPPIEQSSETTTLKLDTEEVCSPVGGSLQSSPPVCEDYTRSGDVVMSVATLIVTRARYHLASTNYKIRYTSSSALFNSLELLSSNVCLLRIRVHEIWDSLMHSLETNSNLHTDLDTLTLLTTHTYEFIEKRLVSILRLLECYVMKDCHCVTMAEELNNTLKYRYYDRLATLLLSMSFKVADRTVFSKIMLLSLLISSPRTAASINGKIVSIFTQLSIKNPTLVRNVLLEVGKGDAMNEPFIQYALHSSVRVSTLKKRLSLSTPLLRLNKM